MENGVMVTVLQKKVMTLDASRLTKATKVSEDENDSLVEEITRIKQALLARRAQRAQAVT